jgi:Zinc carboxypeptidase
LELAFFSKELAELRTSLSVLLLLIVFSKTTSSQTFEYLPGAKYDPSIPTLKQITGHAWGEKITMHHEMERYARALEQSSGGRLKAIKYGETWEGKALYYFVIGSAQNLSSIDTIKTGIQRLADPRHLSTVDAGGLIKTLPSIVWLICGVHGNEISSVDAALLTAYHLLAAQNDEIATLAMANSLVLIDPMQNPDGRDRFISYFRQTVGRWPDADMQAAEHNEGWPSGRVNHYLFDMNRDWFAQTQPETKGRTRAFLEWYPQVFADLHEMGTDSTYYFAPPALPYNPNITKPQLEWLRSFGRNHGKWFDRFRFDYFTRENYDSFYPGYGEGWPMFHGSIGMTYEQASVRGLIARRRDDTDLLFRDSVQHHLVAALSTIEHTARNREALLQYFYEYRKTAAEEAAREAMKEYIIAPGSDPNRSARLAATLMLSGIEVKRADAPFSNPKTRDYVTGNVDSRDFPAGTFVVSLAQPAKRMARTLMDRRTEQDREFIEEQRVRNQRRQPEQFYDVTAWSLPFLFDVPCYTADQESTGQFTVLKEVPRPAGQLHGGRATLAYVIPWGSQSAGSALADLFRENLRVHSSDKPFRLNGKSFPAGSLIVKTKDNPSDLQDRIGRLVNEHGVDVYSTDTAWVDDGPNFGSSNVRFLPRPKIALAYNTPTSVNSAGWTRYLIEQRYGYPVTLIRTESLRSADLTKYNVLILPDGGAGYAAAIGDAARLREWISTGGTLVALAGATAWLTDEKVNLLPSKRERREKLDAKPEKPLAAEQGAPKPLGRGGEAKEQTNPTGQSRPGEPSTAAPAAATASKETGTDKLLEPREEWPSATPGALVRVSVDRQHWLGFGYGETTTVMVDSNRIFTPLRLDQGTNVARFLSDDRFLASGLIWDDARKQLPGKAFLMYSRIGRGHIVAFTEDPNYRAFMDGLNLMFLNGIFLSPGH